MNIPALIGGGVAAALAVALVVSQIQNAGLKHDLKGANASLEIANQALGSCHANVTVMQSAIDGQNASIAAAKAKGDQIAADAARAVQQAQDALQKARKAASAISAPIVATGACERVSEIDKRFLEAVK